MKVRELLMKAQEAEAVADAAQSPDTRRLWESLAAEYRSLAEEIRRMGRGSDPPISQY